MASFPSSSAIPLIDGSETRFCMSSECLANSRYGRLNVDSFVLGSSSGALLAPLELSPSGIFPAPVLVGLVGGGGGFWIFRAYKYTLIISISMHKMEI
jgi:hypothetical protein